ncbi:MAG: fimbria/pilus outer membrane usher protein [Vulcanimicrobiaceae bacterium]
MTSFDTAIAEDQRAVLTLRVNMVTKQDVTVTLRGDDVLLKRADLEAAGLHGFKFEDRGNPSDLISLSSLRPDLTFHIDDVALVLDISARTNHLDANLVDFGSHQDIKLAKPARSAFLNYSLSTSNQTGEAFSTEFGTHVGAGMFSSTASLAVSQQYRSSITRWIFDSPQSDRRLTIGDVLTSTGDLGGTVAIAGVGLQRYFGLNPNTVKTVLPDISGNALTPSTADIYVNGALYRHQILPPGQFSFRNLPIAQGPNTTTVVVTDAFGRQQSYSNYFYGADTLLAHGLSDFSYGVGLLHSQFGEQIGSGPAAAARYAVGLTDNVTGGGRLEISRSLVSGGPTFTFRLPHGVLGAEAALSRDGSGAGRAALVSYQYMSPLVSGALSVTYESAHYAALSLPSSQDRPLINASLSIAKQLTRRSGLALSYIRQQDRDNGLQTGLQLSQTAMLAESTQLQVSENLTTGPAGKRFGVQSSLYFIPRQGFNASVTATNSGGQTQTTAQLSHSLASETPSLGYTLSATGGQGSSSGYASADYHGQYGDYIANVGIASGQNSYALTAAGGLVFIGGRLFPTQSVDDSYALVDTGGLAGVRILANNVVMGRTNKQGLLLVSRLGSYYNNDITIASADTPLDYSIDAETERIAPMYRSGDVVHFGINRVQPVTGNLLVRFGASTVVPAFGMLEVESDERTLMTSDIGEGGEFYFDKLSSGVHHARIKFKDGDCRFDLKVPSSPSVFLKLGAVVCENGVRS